MNDRVGFLILLVVPQIMLAVPPVLAGLASPVPTSWRLGWRRGQWPVWAWMAAAFATPLIGLGSSIAIGLLVEESVHLQEMTEMFRKQGEGWFMIPLALLIGITPAMCEEILFRGYVQTRLTRSFGPLMGILAASVLFAAFHMDFVHSIAVFPIGLFLGFVRWQSGSILPAMMGHFVNNAVSILLLLTASDPSTQTVSIPSVLLVMTVLLAGIASAGLVATATLQFGPPERLSDPDDAMLEATTVSHTDAPRDPVPS